MKSLEDMAKILYPDQDEQVIDYEEEQPEGPEREPVLTEEQQEFMDWFNSLNIPDHEET